MFLLKFHTKIFSIYQCRPDLFIHIGGISETITHSFFFLTLQFFLCSFFFCVFTLMFSFLQFYKFQCKSFQTLLYFYVLLGLRISIRTSLVCHNPMLMFYLSHIVNLLDQVNSQWCVFVMITLYITQSALETVRKLYGEICVMMCGCRVVRKMQKTQVGMMN